MLNFGGVIFQGLFLKTYLPILATPWHCDGRYPAPHRSARRCAPAREGLAKPVGTTRGVKEKNPGQHRKNHHFLTGRYIHLQSVGFFLIGHVSFLLGGEVTMELQSHGGITFKCCSLTIW